MKFVTKLAASLCAVSFLLSGCGAFRTNPIVPNIIEDATPSWDGEERNSGLLDYIDGKGYLITPNAAGRYNTLVRIYGTKYAPAILEGDGLTEDPDSENYYLDSQHMVEFMVMNQKFKSRIDNIHEIRDDK